MMNKKEKIKQILELAKERGINIKEGYLNSLSMNKLNDIEKNIRGVNQGSYINSVAPKVNVKEVPSVEEGTKNVRKVKKINKLPEGKVLHHGIILDNPFKLPVGMNIREAMKWATEHVDILNSPEYKKWKRTPEGRKTMRYGGLEASLGPIEDLIVNFNARQIKAKREIEKKAGKISTSASRPKTLAELAKRVKEIEKRVERIEAKEKEMPGYMYLRKKALERMEKQRQELKKRRRR
jgi:chaperonin cofactor prefoldin